MTSPALSRNRCVDDCLECRLLQRLKLGHCDGTLDLVDEWGCERDIDVDSLLALMESRGGFCDCEVLLNVLLRGRLVVEGLVLCCGTT